MNPWLWLVAAGLVEVAWTQSIAPTEGFTRPVQTSVCFILGASSVYLLSQAMQGLPVGTSYVVFTGIGSLGAVALGVYLRDDPVNVPRIIGVALVVGGIIVCHLAEGAGSSMHART